MVAEKTYNEDISLWESVVNRGTDLGDEARGARATEWPSASARRPPAYSSLPGGRGMAMLSGVKQTLTAVILAGATTAVVAVAQPTTRAPNRTADFAAIRARIASIFHGHAR